MAKPFSISTEITYKSITADTEDIIKQYRTAYDQEHSATERLHLKSYAFGAYQAWLRISFYYRKNEDAQRLQELIEFT